MNEKICKFCGEILPADSIYCQYCGSKNIEEYKSNKYKKVFQCNNCNREITSDSKFCQYCGSSNIGYVEKEVTISDIQKKYKTCPYCNEMIGDNSAYCPVCYKKLPVTETVRKNNNDNYDSKSTRNNENKKSHKIVIAIVAILVLLFVSYEIYNNSNLGKQEKIDERNRRLVENQEIHSDYFANKYIVTSTSNKILIFAPGLPECNLYWSCDNEDILGVWGEWEEINGQWCCPFTVGNTNCESALITFSNDYNDHKFYVCVTK